MEGKKKKLRVKREKNSKKYKTQRSEREREKKSERVIESYRGERGGVFKNVID